MNLRSPNEPEATLAKFTVRIQIPGRSGYGTGFFVAPNLILTCAHVVELNGKIISKLDVWWQNNPYSATVEPILDADLGIDIALLKLVDLSSPDFIPLVDTAAQIGAEIYTFGYPDLNPDGEPATYEIEGLTGNTPPLFKFKQGQVRPGFSGSPMLNRQTGRVCGMIHITRDRSSDLGGKGIPVAVILEHFPELTKTSATNQTFINDNPFIPLSGKISSGDQVFGRDKEVQYIFDLLNGGSGVALIGMSGIGKSSILQIIAEQAKNKLYIRRQPIYLNLGRCSNDNDFYAELCRLVGIKYDDADPLKTRKFDRQIDEYRLLLILDGVHVMAWDGFTNPVREHIRGLADNGNDSPLRLVVAAEKPLGELFPDSSDKTSPFKNVCLELEINHWQPDTIKNFIARKLANNTISFAEYEIEGIIRDSGGLPQQVMQLCSQLYQSKTR